MWRLQISIISKDTVDDKPISVAGISMNTNLMCSSLVLENNLVLEQTAYTAAKHFVPYHVKNVNININLAVRFFSNSRKYNVRK